MSVLPIGFGSADEGGYQIERSLRFDSSASAYLNRTPASAGNRKTWTWSGWVKRSALGANQSLFYARSDNTDANYLGIYFGSDDRFNVDTYSQNYRASSSLYRDVSAWYHLVVAWDTTQATANNRIRMYVNGSEITSFVVTNNPTQNYDGAINNTIAHAVGVVAGASLYFNGYLTEINFIDGSALDPTSFGEFNEDTGVWQPKAYTGSYGTNGFYLDFADNSGTTSTTLGADSSGNGNNWTPNNFSVTAGAGNDSLVDSPTRYGTDTGAGGEVRGNYATLNPLDNGGHTLSNGNLAMAGASAYDTTRSTFGMSSGKWYVEATITIGTSGGTSIGIATAQAPLNNYLEFSAYGWCYNQSNGNKGNNNSYSAYGASYTTGDVIGIAFDADTGTLTFYKNGVSQGTAYSSLTTGPYFFAGTTYYSDNSFNWNFGQRPFAYTAPSGFKALCTTNLPDPIIAEGKDYFNAVTYTGNATERTIDVGFQPDFLWIKTRSNASSHNLVDAVRGVKKLLNSNNTDAELTESDTAGIDSFVSNGFTLEDATFYEDVNQSGRTYVAWNWKANGAGVSNTDGTITSTVSANTTSGVSIITYTGNNTSGATVGHGLGVKPAFIIVKKRTGTDGWGIYHTSLGATKTMELNTTGGEATSAIPWNNTEPTSSVIYLNGNNYANSSSFTYIMYAFAAVPGFSSMGSYVGNGSADGPFVYTGFRPAYVMVKRFDDVNSWNIWDNKRNPYNQQNNVLYANSASAEDTRQSDFVSNGFKLRGTSTEFNASGGIYIYMAFAENPFAYSLAR